MAARSGKLWSTATPAQGDLGIFGPNGTGLPQANGVTASWGSTRVTAPGGVYQLCWCGTGFSCSQAESFRVSSGVLHVRRGSGRSLGKGVARMLFARSPFRGK
eukprot:7681184-Alexandrium_andersonii.AAC.1